MTSPGHQRNFSGAQPWMTLESPYLVKVPPLSVFSRIQDTWTSERTKGQVGWMLETAGRIPHNNVSRMCKIPKEQICVSSLWFSQAYTCISYLSHAITKCLTIGNLREEKVCFGSQSEVTHSIMACHIASTHRNLRISRKWGRAIKPQGPPPVTVFLQQNSTS